VSPIVTTTEHRRSCCSPADGPVMLLRPSVLTHTRVKQLGYRSKDLFQLCHCERFSNICSHILSITNVLRGCVGREVSVPVSQMAKK
jgi:hypothetical protein